MRSFHAKSTGRHAWNITLNHKIPYLWRPVSAQLPAFSRICVPPTGPNKNRKKRMLEKNTRCHLILAGDCVTWCASFGGRAEGQRQLHWDPGSNFRNAEKKKIGVRLLEEYGGEQNKALTLGSRL